MKLRPVRVSDAARIQRLVADPEVRALTNMPDPYPADGAARWLAEEMASRTAGTSLALAIVVAGELVGVCAVSDIGGEPRSGELGYWVARQAWGRGYASEAVARVVAMAFAHHGLASLEASVLASHTASRRVLEKNGFRAVHQGPSKHPKWGPDDVFVYYRLERPNS